MQLRMHRQSSVGLDTRQFKQSIGTNRLLKGLCTVLWTDLTVAHGLLRRGANVAIDLSASHLTL